MPPLHSSACAKSRGSRSHPCVPTVSLTELCYQNRADLSINLANFITDRTPRCLEMRLLALCSWKRDRCLQGMGHLSVLST